LEQVQLQWPAFVVDGDLVEFGEKLHFAPIDDDDTTTKNTKDAKTHEGGVACYILYNTGYERCDFDADGGCEF
jgi:hypothetical protein